MNGTDAFRWALYYRLLASVSFVLGIAVAAVGVWLGAGDFLDTLLFGEADALLSGEIDSPNSPVIAAIGVVVGVLVWQVGKAAALHKTLTEATQAELADDLDHEAMKSDLLNVLDERLSDMHAEVEQTRRGVNSLQQDQHADEFAMDSMSTDTSAATEGTGATTKTQSTPTETNRSTADDPEHHGGAGAQSEPNTEDSGEQSAQSDPNAAFDS